MKKALTAVITAVLIFQTLIIVSSNAIAAYDTPFQRILYIPKAEQSPNLFNIDDSWGDSLIHVTNDLPDAKVVKYWAEDNDASPEQLLIDPEPCDFRFYACWDNDYIYLGIKSPDHDPCGYLEMWSGDGVQLWIKHRNSVSNPYDYSSQNMFSMFWTLDMDDYTVDYGDIATNLEPVLSFDAGSMEALIRIPFSDIGIKSSEIKDGLPLAMVLMRISSKTVEDEGLAGWMIWGDDHVITLVLDDPEIENKPLDTIPPENSPEGETDSDNHTTDFSGISKWAKDEVESAVAAGLVPENLQSNWTAPVTRGQFTEMIINLLEAATGKTIDELLEERGAVINKGRFKDTDDENVYAANALGIINGTSSKKFSPEGTLKRVQMAAIVNRIASFMGYSTDGYTHHFKDITSDYSWADSELGWPVANGIINGVSSKKFNPGGELTIEQAILIMNRLLSFIEK